MEPLASGVRARTSRLESCPRTRSKRQWLWLGPVLIAVAAGLALNALGVRGPRWLECWPSQPGFETWQPLAPGLDYARAWFAQPRPLKCHALRLDLQDPLVKVMVPRGPGDEEGHTHALLPSTWLRRHDLTAAINATPFSPERVWPGQLTQLQGLAVSRGEMWSPPRHNLDALLINSQQQARLVLGSEDVRNVVEGVGGFLVVLTGGRNRGEDSPKDAASLVGISADGRWMYWLVVDGGQPGYSEGVTPKEAAELLRQLGANDGLRLDGGSSTALVAARGWSGAAVLNRPRSPFYAGIPRPVGNVLGVRSVSP
jgi:hypothetical protein